MKTNICRIFSNINDITDKTLNLYFRNVNARIQELSEFLQTIKLAKSYEVLTPKSNQKYLQAEIEKVC